MVNAIELEQQYGAKNYHPLPVVLQRGQGVYVWDDQGKRYIDMMSAYSAVSHGHCHPALVSALCAQARQLGVVSRAFYSSGLGSFLQKLCELTHQQQALPMNTGAEAVETALKAARKWAYSKKGVIDNQAQIIACHGNFHGRTIAIVGLSSEAQYRQGFGPFPAGLVQIPYGDAQALAAAITPNTAAFLVEPIQGEGGIIMPPSGYLRECEKICRANNVLFIVDEIQTGMGRTGRLLACWHEEVQPDLVILGKALGGGLLPVSAVVGKREVLEVFTPGDHGSTFGGYPLAAAVGSIALDLLEQEGMISNSAMLGKHFLTALQALPHRAIKEVRGKGLFIGMEIDAHYATAREVCLALMEKGLLSKETHNTVVRLAPPLIITQAQLDEAVALIDQVLAKFTTVRPQATEIVS
jgi:ornithine--oxo-acid transaminase